MRRALDHGGLVALLAVAALACGSSDGDPVATGGMGGASSSDGGATSAGGMGGAPGTGGTTSSMGTGGIITGPVADFDGAVLDENGAPVIDAPIQLCAEVCYLAFTTFDGSFTYDGVPSGHYKLDVRGPADSPIVYGAVNFPLDLPDDGALSLMAPVVLPETGPGTSLGAGAQQIAVDTLTVTVDAAQLMLPLGVDSPYFAGTRVALDDAPPNVPPSGTPVAWWAFNPFGTIATTPVPFTIVEDLGLGADAPVSLYTVNDQTGELDLVLSTQVAPDGQTLTVDGGAGLGQITWLAVVAD